MRARNWARIGCAWVCCFSILRAQQSGVAPVRPSAPVILRPYLPPAVPPARLGNSPRLQRLTRAGILYLTARDAIALALENNLAIETARYNPIDAEWQLERSAAGGALPGVPSGASQVGSVASGQGVAGSQAAAGVSTGASGLGGGTSSNATISQIGPVTQTLDPTLQESSVFSHQSTPQQNATQSVAPVLLSNTRVSSGTYQQGFLFGGNVTASYTDSYLNENAATDVLNPSSAPALSISFQQNLLQGFGIAVNERTINVSRLNVRASELNFRVQVINTVASVLNVYYGLVADYEDLRAKRDAVDVAQRLVDNNRRQEQAGTMSRLDVTTAEAQLASNQNDLVVSQTALRQQEIQLKNLLSRTGTADPALFSAQIMPLDRIIVPEKDDLPPLAEMVRTALAHRSDLEAERLGVTSAQISALGTRNGILPNLQVTGTESAAGLSGTPRAVASRKGTETANPYFTGDVGVALGQVFRRDFPTNRALAVFQMSVGNRQAQADAAIDQLSLRQTEIGLNKDLNQASVDVSNYAIAARQAQARYRAAVQTRILDATLLDQEQKRLFAGLSTAYNVIQQQQILAAAQSAEIAAEVAYSNARIALDQTMGTTLESNHVSIDEARSGVVAEPPQGQTP